jgi:hypothetical protein
LLAGHWISAEQPWRGPPVNTKEFMEDYIPQFVPARIRHHIDYFFDIYDAEEKRIKP